MKRQFGIRTQFSTHMTLTHTTTTTLLKYERYFLCIEIRYFRILILKKLNIYIFLTQQFVVGFPNIVFTTV